jgi:hypothetical protein
LTVTVSERRLRAPMNMHRNHLLAGKAITQRERAARALTAFARRPLDRNPIAGRCDGLALPEAGDSIA